MAKELKYRCGNCGKIFVYQDNMAGETYVCKNCDAQHIIPIRATSEERRFAREVVNESTMAIISDPSICRGERTSWFRVMYSEAPPLEIIRHRTNHAALLDISTGGLGLLYKGNENEALPSPGQVIPIEIDFPILTQPVFIETEIRWIVDVSDEDTILKMGVMFRDPDSKFKEVVKALIDYLKSRPESMEADKWGAI